MGRTAKRNVYKLFQGERLECCPYVIILQFSHFDTAMTEVNSGTG